MNNPSKTVSNHFSGGLWPADVYILFYLLFLIGCVIVAPGELPDRGSLIFEMSLLLLTSLLLVTGADPDSHPIIYLLRIIYPIFPILYAFRLLHFLIPALRTIDGTWENALIHWDQLLFGKQVFLYFDPIRTPVVTELMYYFYVSYYVVPLILVFYIFYRWLHGDFDAGVLRRLSGSLTLGFISSYLIYMLVPARGPWYALETGILQMDPVPTALESAWIGEHIRTAILTMEMKMYDVFPSGHTEIYLICVLLSWRYARVLFWPVLLLFICMAISTMYLRFHYGVDVLAGAVLGVLVFWMQEWIHK